MLADGQQGKDQLYADCLIPVILRLIDVDEDKCLSIAEVFKMIFIIEKNFVTHMNFVTLKSAKTYTEVALNNALRKFKIILTKKHTLDQVDQRFLNQSLITYSEFVSILQQQPKVFENFLPKYVDMVSFLITRFSVPEFIVDVSDITECATFLNMLHSSLSGPKEDQLFATELPVSVTIRQQKYQENQNQQSRIEG